MICVGGASAGGGLRRLFGCAPRKKTPVKGAKRESLPLTGVFFCGSVPPFPCPLDFDLRFPQTIGKAPGGGWGGLPPAPKK